MLKAEHLLEMEDFLISLYGITAPFNLLVFAGLVKNAGKTTALNIVNSLFPDEVIGITSIGHDGEALDAIYRHPKPPIEVRPGQLILTAEKFLPASSAGYQLLEKWGKHTQFGSWLILRIQQAALFRIAGPSSLPELQVGIEKLRLHGAQRVHVDGALDRLSHLLLKDSGIILSTGAALGTSLEDVVIRTRYVLELFQLPRDEDLANTPLDISQNAYLKEGAWVSLPRFLWTHNLKELLPERVECLYFHGAFTDKLYQLLLRAKRMPRKILVYNPCQILLSPNIWQGLKSRNIRLSSLTRPNLLMLTLNPWHHLTPIATEKLAASILPYAQVPLVDMHLRKVWIPEKQTQ
ncbi:MAG TPA: hypothetical protein VFF14_08940 [Candidatus Deferrimicrobium sp.]|nr:hypothetical protein [Candidatus Deferrimicrobium sp.]